jgi:hypothetical protein
VKLDLYELAPLFSFNELIALGDSSLPFDAVALYIRVFCYLDTANGKPVAVSAKAMTLLNGFVDQSLTKPIREARRRTLIRHLERVGLIDKPTLANGPIFKRVYTRLLSEGLTAFTAYEYTKLVDIALSYQALTLYVRVIRPNLNIHTFKAIVSIDTVTQALNFEPMKGSTDEYLIGSKLLKPALIELMNIGLINCIRDDNFYYFTCHVSKGFDSKWLKTLGENL